VVIVPSAGLEELLFFLLSEFEDFFASTPCPFPGPGSIVFSGAPTVDPMEAAKVLWKLLLPVSIEVDLFVASGTAFDNWLTIFTPSVIATL